MVNEIKISILIKNLMFINGMKDKCNLLSRPHFDVWYNCIWTYILYYIHNIYFPKLPLRLLGSIVNIKNLITI